MSDFLPIQPAIAARAMAQGRGWRLTEFVCRAGPADRPFEEQHEQVSIAAVLEGSFSYRADTGHALLHPGALMLGNAGACYECGHDHATGDRCLALHLAPELFAEISASAAGSARFRFPAAMLPAGRDLMAPLVALLAAGEQQLPAEQAAIHLTERVVALLSCQAAPRLVLKARDQRRIGNALQHIAAQAGEPLGLDDLAAVAGMSKYHFLRCFRSVTGLAPYEYLLNLRLRRAALRLCQSSAPVAAIAFDCGFGDLSTFNARFKAQFGLSPRRFRARHRSPAG
ncbi:AraC family transcriptional regulator [Ferrovibrio sp.]|uniref:AraC family transcriptional regulator n=1 Tax=Ferrovibrio sp. TaxID=1917215 RepID=UPI001B453DE2|nr:AraC family transcriptional regulator [Ferrovibrio sp.]MBP7064080.1 helix-turn-helix transcriptional regulator [Ferrovibrio sp.]